MKKAELKDSRIVRQYSESFKLKVLEELSQGKSTKNELVKKYGISFGNLYFWIRKHRVLY
jgi:transposase-like protein